MRRTTTIRDAEPIYRKALPASNLNSAEPETETSLRSSDAGSLETERF